MVSFPCEVTHSELCCCERVTKISNYLIKPIWFSAVYLVSLRHPLSKQTPCGELFQNIEQLCFLMKTATCSVSFLRMAFSTLV